MFHPPAPVRWGRLESHRLILQTGFPACCRSCSSAWQTLTSQRHGHRRQPIFGNGAESSACSRVYPLTPFASFYTVRLRPGEAHRALIGKPSTAAERIRKEKCCKATKAEQSVISFQSVTSGNLGRLRIREAQSAALGRTGSNRFSPIKHNSIFYSFVEEVQP